ncbi:MAG: sialate O-acetylesterase [Planctomycetota bacterium]|jgi:alpha-galactosidase
MRWILPAVVAVAGCAGSADVTPMPAPTARSAPRDGARLKVFILSGQSNMEGVGKVESDEKGSLRYIVSDPATRERYRHLQDEDGKWVERDDVWIWSQPHKGKDRRGKLTVGYGASPGMIGPEFGFGLMVGDHLDEQALLIKIAWGGKSLAGDFRPPSSGGDVGPYYTEMLKHARDVLADVGTLFPDYDGRGYEIAGFGWHQGWNDGCTHEATNEYEKNMANFIRDVRKALGVKDLPFVIANSGFAGWKQKVDRRLKIMAAQAAVAEYDEFRGNVVTVETRDFFRGYPSRHNYHWNFNGETYYLVGESMGKAMAKLLDR